MARFTSRKFLVSCAIILGGIASVISGACIENNTLIILGSICATLSSVIYALVECICDTTSMDDSVGVLEDEIENEEGDGSVG